MGFLYYHGEYMRMSSPAACFSPFNKKNCPEITEITLGRTGKTRQLKGPIPVTTERGRPAAMDNLNAAGTSP
jgi:hypothetical protein